MTLEQIKEYLNDHCYEDTLVFESPDYANAFLGVTDEGRAVYDYEKMITCLVEEDNMDEEEAIEFIDYNTLRAIPYFGSNAPIILYSAEPYL